ncbi:MAG: sulfite exporter TauE/SafE family protein, partial [Acidobacteria bacterium]|nr:sulfite exporter TauE/SafE family protein [Acidobacteriota bacterium]
PIFAVYCVAVALPKFEFVGTSAWFFLLVNAFKVPFSVALGLIHGQTLLLNVALLPAIVIGLLGGRAIIGRVPQRVFDVLLLAFAAAAALRLIGDS